MPDDLRKVRSGQPLRIPAGAYNAFVDAAVDLRTRQGAAKPSPVLSSNPPSVASAWCWSATTRTN